MTRVALYARVSTEEQAQKYGLPSQLRELRDAAAPRGYEIVAEFIDDGVSGATLNRAALDRLRSAVRTRAVDVVLIHDPDRLARKLVDQLIVTDEIERAGVRLEFLTVARDVSPEGELLLQVKGVIAEYERKKIAERTQRGRRERARSGKVSVYPFGYRKDGATVVVDEVEADVVRTVFGWLIDEGRSTHSIVRQLRAQAVVPPKGARWSSTTVRRLLRNPYYTGRTWFNRATVVHGPDGERRQPRPDAEWIAIDVPAIIPPERLAAAARQLARNRAALSGRPGRLYLLRGLLRCGDCGRRLVGDFARGWPRYRCPGHRAYVQDAPCSTASVAAARVERPVWEAVVAILRDPGLLERKQAERQTRAGVREIEVRSEIEHLARERARLERDEQRLLDLYLAEDVIDLPMVRARLAAVRERRQAVAERLERARPVVASATADETQQAATQQACARLLKGVERLDPRGRHELLTLLLDEIVVRGQDLEIHGILPSAPFHDKPGILRRASWSSAQYPAQPEVRQGAYMITVPVGAPRG